jgi:hypothetical protein
MRRVMVLGLVLGVMVLGSAMVSIAQEAPKLEKVWAPQGDMRWLVVTAGGPGITKPVGSAPIRLSKGLKDLNGYVYWDSSKAAQKSGTATVEILVEDMKGNESEAKSVTIKLVAKGAKAEKAPAEFQEVEIGPILIKAIGKVTP